MSVFIFKKYGYLCSLKFLIEQLDIVLLGIGFLFIGWISVQYVLLLVGMICAALHVIKIFLSES
ncbi:hypothetical protein [Bartonella sp. CB60]|uniref:hypothetical protein n=1 Tax=Bartonella sp. CB60 TaxID=3113619 RepID=UPI00300E14FE